VVFLTRKIWTFEEKGSRKYGLLKKEVKSTIHSQGNKETSTKRRNDKSKHCEGRKKHKICQFATINGAPYSHQTKFIQTKKSHLVFYLTSLLSHGAQLLNFAALLLLQWQGGKFKKCPS